MGAVSSRHVLRQRFEVAFAVTAGMACDPLALGQHFDGVARDAQFHLLTDEGMRHAVIVVFVFDVVIDINASSLPFGEHEWGVRKRPQVRCIEQFEGFPAAAGEFLEWAIVERRQQFSNGGIEFGDREEAPVTKPGQYPALDHLNADFDLGFILRLSGSGWQDHRAVVVGEFSGGSIERRFVSAALLTMATVARSFRFRQLMPTKARRSSW